MSGQTGTVPEALTILVILSALAVCGYILAGLWGAVGFPLLVLGLSREGGL